MSERQPRASLMLGGIDHRLTREELLGVRARVDDALASLLNGVCSECGGRMDARCFVCDAKVFGGEE